MFDVADTVFSYWRALIVCLFLQESFKVKESSLYVIWNTDTAFLRSGAEIIRILFNYPIWIINFEVHVHMYIQ